MEGSRLGLLPLRERPTGRIVERGANSVSFVELLASLVGGGRQIEVAEDLVGRFGSIHRLAQATTGELAQTLHIGEAGAARLKAALELGRRLFCEGPVVRPRITSPADAANLVLLEMSVLEKEEVRVVILDTRNRVLNIPTIYVGSLNANVVRLAELFRDAIRQNAAAIIVIHNHPSGDPTPSPEDVCLTQKLVQAGKLLDVEVLDHLIIGQGRFVSLKERGLGF